MADAKLSDVVVISEGGRPGIGPDSHDGTANAAMYLVCRLLTDAIFSNDIRAIQLIVSRIDGGLPKDVEMGDYRTRFSDCLAQVMHMERSSQLSLAPEDTVLMGLCKSLYALAVQDIYWDADRGRMRRPSTDRKQERDAAMRIILERLGGRKTLTAEGREAEELEDADWIAALPSGK